MLNKFSKISLILSVFSASQTMGALQDRTNYDEPNQYRYPVSPEMQPNRAYLPANRHLLPKRLDFHQHAPIATFKCENGMKVERFADGFINVSGFIPVGNLPILSEGMTDAQFINELTRWGTVNYTNLRSAQ